MIYHQSGQPSQSFIRQTLNVFYYSTGFYTCYMPSDGQNLAMEAIMSLPAGKYPDKSAIEYLKDHAPVLTKPQIIQVQRVTLLCHPLFHQNQFHGLFLADISSAESVQLQPLLHLLGLCVRSDQRMKSNFYMDPKLEMPTGRHINQAAEHHPYDIERKRFIRMLMTGTQQPDFTDDYIFPQLGPDELRSTQNYAIIGISLLARTAISLGLDSETAYSISDHYIVQVEQCHDLIKIRGLQNQSIADYHLLLTESANRLNPVIKDLITYIEDHIHQNLVLKSYAETKKLNYAYVSSLFTKQIGKSFTHYVKEKKIELSKDYLRQTTDKINVISEKLGYPYPYQFNRDFKKLVGVTPLSYRHGILKDG